MSITSLASKEAPTLAYLSLSRFCVVEVDVAIIGWQYFFPSILKRHIEACSTSIADRTHVGREVSSSGRRVSK